MEKKQTAVEWLASYIKGITDLNCDEIIELAKQMEKEQHEETWASAWNESAKSGDFDDYYNETYGDVGHK